MLLCPNVKSTVVDIILSNGCVEIFTIFYSMTCTVHVLMFMIEKCLLYPQLIHYLGVSIICHEGSGVALRFEGKGGVIDSKPLR